VPSEWAPAKVNLFLHVVGRRADGYHLLDSLVVFAGAADRVTAAPAATLELTVTGPGAAALAGDPTDNLVLRAARALAASAGVLAGARLVLEKTLPVASGIGGGSADAAAALRLLGRMWEVSVPAAELAAMAQAIGADVPVCFAGRPARMGGVGEILADPPALPPFGLVLVNPGVAVSTPAVFRARAASFSHCATLPAGWADAAAMAADLADLANDLEAPARTLCPAIDAVLAALRGAPGCLLARMSGSGATCFGLFADAGAARIAAEAVRRPGWWVWGGPPHAAAVEAAAVAA
jgi:4-diphosphocytidyl-2-C-methyl-D-erythritol kinase